MKFQPDMKTATGRKWAALMGKARTAQDKPRRAKRFTGDHSQHKAWVREMGAGPGRFIETPRQPNWLNTRMHWAEKARVTGSQFENAFSEVRGWRASRVNWPGDPPYLVTLTRYGPNLMDDDGNAAALKHYRDGVAAALGIDDGDAKRLRFKCKQVRTDKRGRYGVRIEIARRTRRGGFTIVPPPSDPERRALLEGPDIGGIHLPPAAGEAGR